MALDAGQIIKRSYDPTKLALRGKDEGAATAPKPVQHLDAKQILKRVFDAATVSLQMVKV